MLKVFYGPNSFAKNVELQKLRLEFEEKNGVMSIRSLAADSLSLTNFQQDLVAFGMFAKNELIIVSHAEDNLEIIEAALQAPETDSKTVILLINQLDKRTSQYKSVSKHSGFVDFPQLSEVKLSSWAGSVAKNLNFSISSPVLTELTQRTNSDQQEVWICLNQLSLMHKDKIESADLDIILPPSAAENAFNLLESALKKDYKKMEATLKELELFREDPYQIIGLVASQVHSLSAICLGQSFQKSPQTMASELGIHPYAASQQARLASSLSLTKKRISEIISAIRWLDLSLKTINKTEPWPMLDAALRRASMA